MNFLEIDHNRMGGGHRIKIKNKIDKEAKRQEICCFILVTVFKYCIMYNVVTMDMTFCHMLHFIYSMARFDFIFPF